MFNMFNIVSMVFDIWSIVFKIFLKYVSNIVSICVCFSILKDMCSICFRNVFVFNIFTSYDRYVLCLLDCSNNFQIFVRYVFDMFC